MDRNSVRQTEGQRPLSKIKTESREDYLKALYVFSGMCNGNIRSYELAEYMGLSKASVCRMVGIMKNDGLISMAEDFTISLTEAGEAEAQKVYKKFRFFEEMLTIAGVEPSVACEEACRLEHMLSEDSFYKLRTYWGDRLHTTSEG